MVVAKEQLYTGFLGCLYLNIKRTNTVSEQDLIRRRFYLSKESLDYLDALALQHNLSPSILLDTIVKQLITKKNKS